MRVSCRLGLLSFGLLFCATATADPDPSQRADVAAAARFFDQGLEHFRLREFNAAVTDFEAALRIKPHRSVLFNLGRAYASAGRPVEAVRTLEQYLTEEGAALSARRRRAVVELLESQRQQLSMLTVGASEPKTAISIDGVVVGETPLQSAVPVAPGSHEVTGTRSGFLPASIKVQTAPLQALEFELKLEPIRPAPSTVEPTVTSTPQPTNPDTMPQHVTAVAKREPAAIGRVTPNDHPSKLTGRLGIVVLGVGIASTALGSYFAIRAKDGWDERNQHCPVARCDDVAVDASRSAKRFAVGADVSLALGLVTMGAGLYLILKKGSASAKTAGARVSIGTGTHTWLVQLGGSL